MENDKETSAFSFPLRQRALYAAVYAFLLAGAGLLFFRSGWACCASLVLIPQLLKWKQKQRRERWRRRIRNQFCDVLQLLSVSLLAGRNMENAFSETVNELNFLYGNEDFMVRELRGIAAKLNMNYSLSVLLQELVRRTQCEEIGSFWEAERVCRKLGGNIVELIRNTYHTILQKNEMEQEVEAICTQQRMSFYILMVIPFVVFGMMSLLSPDYIDALFTPKGRLFVILAMIFMLWGYLLGNRILLGSEKAPKQPVKKKSFPRRIVMISDSLIRKLYRIEYERNLQKKFEALYRPNGEMFYRRHRQRQLVISTALGFFLLFLILADTEKWAEVTVLMICGLLATFILPDRNISEVLHKRQRAVDAQLPAFLSKLAILTDAGITIKAAIMRITQTMQESELKIQLEYLTKDFRYGESDTNSFEQFAKRCGTKDAAAFSSLVLQNIRKGGRELSGILRLYARSSWEQYRNDAKIRGEQMAMKLMIPTLLTFLSLMILMAAPALVQLNILE